MRPIKLSLLSILILSATIISLLITACAPKAENEADVVLFNGVIYTADNMQSTVSALAIKDNKIIYTGDTTTAQTYVGKQTRQLDLEVKW